jgi:hypothetical protein
VRAGSSSASTLTIADAEAIERDVGPVARVSYIDRQVAQAQFGSNNWTTAVEGVTPAFLGCSTGTPKRDARSPPPTARPPRWCA